MFLIINCKFEMNCTLLNNNTKVIQKNKKQYDVTIKYCRVQLFSAKVNLSSKQKTKIYKTTSK